MLGRSACMCKDLDIQNRVLPLDVDQSYDAGRCVQVVVFWHGVATYTIVHVSQA